MTEHKVEFDSTPVKPQSGRKAISWDPLKLRRFEHALAAADDPEAVITFDGHDFVVGYGRYLAEHLRTLLNGGHGQASS